MEATDANDTAFIRTSTLLFLLDEVIHSHGELSEAAFGKGLSPEECKRDGSKGGILGLINLSIYFIPVEVSTYTRGGGKLDPKLLPLQGVSIRRIFRE